MAEMNKQMEAGNIQKYRSFNRGRGGAGDAEDGVGLFTANVKGLDLSCMNVPNE